MQQLQPFCAELFLKTSNAGDIAAGPVEILHQSCAKRIDDVGKDDRNACSRLLRRQRGIKGRSPDRIDAAVNELSGERRKPAQVSPRPAVLDIEGVTFDEI